MKLPKQTYNIEEPRKMVASVNLYLAHNDYYQLSFSGHKCGHQSKQLKKKPQLLAQSIWSKTLMIVGFTKEDKGFTIWRTRTISISTGIRFIIHYNANKNINLQWPSWYLPHPNINISSFSILLLKRILLTLWGGSTHFHHLQSEA